MDQFGFVSQQRGAFEHAAEVLFAGVLMLAGAALQAFERFVANCQPFQIHDADIFFAAFPNLVLLKFHWLTVVLKSPVSQRQIQLCKWRGKRGP